MNAFQYGSKIYFDIPQAENNSFPFFPDIHGAPFDPEAALPYLHRWVVDNLATNYSDFVMLEATNLADGPIARLKLTFRLRSGLHGNWADESKLAPA